jgi:hypothetical protein
MLPTRSGTKIKLYPELAQDFVHFQGTQTGV